MRACKGCEVLQTFRPRPSLSRDREDQSTYHWRDLGEQAFAVKNTDSIASYKSAKGIPNHGQPRYFLTGPCELLHLLLNLMADPLAAAFDSVVCRIAAVAFRNEDV